MKYQYNYIARNLKDTGYVFRLLKYSPDHIHATFLDADYGGKRKAKKAADVFGQKTLNSLPKKLKSKLRDGYPKFKKGSGVMLCTRVIKGKRVPTYYLAKAYDKFTGDLNKKCFSFGEIRSQDAAHRLAKKWRKQSVEEINKKAVTLGYAKQ